MVDLADAAIPDSQAAAPAGKSVRVWGLLNSQFGLWILSTVLIGLISFFYSGFQESNRLYSDDLARMTRLQQEVSDRLEQLDHQVGSTLTIADFATRVNPWGLDGPTGVYPELQNRSLRGMILELESLSRKYQQDPAPTVLHLENVIGMVKDVERRKIAYASMVSENPKLKSQIESFTDLHNQIAALETEFDALELTADKTAIVGLIRGLIAPPPVATAHAHDSTPDRKEKQS
jgi:hypothetical protein